MAGTRTSWHKSWISLALNINIHDTIISVSKSQFELEFLCNRLVVLNNFDSILRVLFVDGFNMFVLMFLHIIWSLINSRLVISRAINEFFSRRIQYHGSIDNFSLDISLFPSRSPARTACCCYHACVVHTRKCMLVLPLRFTLVSSSHYSNQDQHVDPWPV